MFFCDFCTAPLEKVTDGWSYNADAFILQALDEPKILFGSDPGWLACTKCAAMVDSGEAAALEEKAVRHNVQHVGITDEMEIQIVRSMIHRLHSEFWKTKKKEATN